MITVHMLKIKIYFYSRKKNVGAISMEWVDLVMGHPYITIGLLVLCLLFFSFPSILWIILIGIVMLVLWKISSIFP